MTKVINTGNDYDLELNNRKTKVVIQIIRTATTYESQLVVKLKVNPNSWDQQLQMKEEVPQKLIYHN